MKTGWLELLIIALAIMWLLNTHRKYSILRKMDKEMDRRAEKSQNPKKPKGTDSKEIEAEDVDYEEIK